MTLDAFQVLASIGKGMYAEVFSVKRKVDGSLFALKEVKIFEMTAKERENCQNEAKLLSYCHHPNIITYESSFLENNKLYIVMELAKGDLKTRILSLREKQEHLKELEVWSYVFGVSAALTYMHEQRVMHRDIKADNVYMCEKGGVKLGDLGLGRVMTSINHAQSIVGTPVYMSPELVQGQVYTLNSDIWSLGCLAYELCCFVPPFTMGKEGYFTLAQHITDGAYQPVPEIYSQDLRNTIAAMLQKDPTKRPTALQVCSVAKSMIEHLSLQQPAAPKEEQVPVFQDEKSGQVGMYEDLGILAQWQHSTVHKAKSRATGQVIAIKRIQIFEMETAERKQCLNEANLLRSLPNHPHIIEYYDSVLQNNQLFLMLELAEMGDLNMLIQHHVQQRLPMEEDRIWSIFGQICEAVRVMHSCRVMHRDIKPANVFIAGGGIVKLGDLGLARHFSPKSKEAFSAVGTFPYMSPELISGSSYGFPSDIWSLGCLLYEMAMLTAPFGSGESNFYSLGKKIMSLDYAPVSNHFSPMLGKVVQAMMNPVAAQRPDISQASQLAREGLRFFLGQHRRSRGSSATTSPTAATESPQQQSQQQQSQPQEQNMSVDT